MTLSTCRFSERMYEVATTGINRRREDAQSLRRHPIVVPGGLRHEGLDLGEDPEQVALIAQAFAGFSARDRQVKPTTYNVRLAILSSFYEYARRRKFLQHNPIEQLDRAKVQEYAHADALDGDMVYAALQRIDERDERGARDYAVLSVLLQTGRRAQEVASLQWQHVRIHNGRATLIFEHCKGDEVMIDEMACASH